MTLHKGAVDDKVLRTGYQLAWAEKDHAFRIEVLEPFFRNRFSQWLLDKFLTQIDSKFGSHPAVSFIALAASISRLVGMVT